MDPYEPRPWFLLSQIYYVLERDEDGDAAKARFDDLNRIAQEVRAAEARLLYDPTQAGIYQRLISLHRQSGNLRAVGLTLTRWLKVEPQSMDIRVAMLALAQEMGEPDTAAALADGFATGSWRQRNSVDGLGAVLRDQSRPREADPGRG